MVRVWTDRLMVLLAIWFPLASTIPALSVMHTHPDGEQHHCHTAAHPAHDHDHVHPELPPRASQLTATGIHWHAHLWFLGLQFHLGNERGSGIPLPNQAFWTAAMLRMPHCVMSPQETRHDQLLDGTVACLECGGAQGAQHESTSAFRTASFPYLCDVARHERSGVQLA